MKNIFLSTKECLIEGDAAGGRHDGGDMKKNTEITVVIPNYNGIQYIDGCLKALYEGTVVPEVIIIDNGSADGSAELAEENYPACRLIRFSENRGFCHAVNEGIRLADTEYVILLNNDTVVDKEFVFRLWKAIRKRKDAFSVSAKMLSMKNPEVIDDAGDLYCALGWAFARGKGKSKVFYSKPAEIFAACGGAAIYRKDVFGIIGYFDENHFAYLEDIDIGYRARISGFRNYFEPDAVVLHAGSAVSGSRYNEFKVRLSSKNSIYMIYKNMPGFQILLNLPLLTAGFLVKTVFFFRKGMGKTYVRGMKEGLRLCLSEDGEKQRVQFRTECLGNYIKIQMELWVNLFRRIFG